MFQKVLGLTGLALVLLIGESFLLSTDVEAANKSSRCRASTAAGFARCKALVGEKSDRVTSRRATTRRARYQTSLRSQRGRMTNTTNRATRRVSTRRQVFNRSTAQRTTGMTQIRKKIQAGVVDFPFMIEEKFSVTSDNLTADQGRLVLSDGNTTIRIIATGDRCDSFRSGVRECFRKLADAEIALLQKYHSHPYLETNTEKVWGKTNNINPYQLTKGNSGRYILLSTQQQYFGRFFFFEPSKDFVWKVEVDAPRGNDSFLSDESGVDRLLLSFFAKEDVKQTATAQRSKRTSTATSSRAISKRRVRRNPRIKISSRDVVEYKADQVPFRFSMPSALTKTSDTLNWDAGAMSFVGEDGTRVFVAATTESCTSQTPRIIRRCIEDAADTMVRRQGAPFLAKNLLQSRNYNLSLNNATGNLLRSQSFNQEIGRFHLYRANGKRYAQLVFRVPVKHNLWAVILEAPEKNDGLLSDTQKLQKTFSSFFFPES